MSREAFGDPPESQEPPDLCPVCGNDWHAEDCEFGKEVARRLKAERDAHRLAVEERTLRLRYGVVSGWIVRALKVLDTLDPDDSTEADELGKLIAAGEMLVLTTLANSKTPNKPLRRSVDGVCTRSTCECEREGLGDQCVWLKPAVAEFECLGEPSLCTNPRGCACVPDSKTPNTELVDKTSEKLRRQVDKMPETPIRRPAIENDAEKMLRLCADDPMWAEHAEVSKPLLLRAADELASLRKDAHRFRKLLMQHKHWLGVFRCDPDGAPSDSLSHVELTALLDAMNGPELNF